MAEVSLDAFRRDLRCWLEANVPDPQKAYLASRAAGIASGTSEIMGGIIAMQFFGLPRGA